MVCYNCFREKSSYGPCPFCGYDPTGAEEKYPLALKPGSILNGRYTVGRVIGQGGFGITYIAQDYQTKERVAIKEYFPSEFAGRSGSDSSIQVHSKDQKENFEYGKNQFLQEAKTLAAFIGDEHIVRIYSYFEENNTAYFVMEYVDGYSLDKYMAQKGGRLSVDEANRLLLPLMKSLDKVHAKGIIHRDIAPDNIIITKDGTAKLIDFGAARYSTGEKSKSLDVVLKHGFAPTEQYMRRGKQGPYTDVYALAATYYYAITGKVLPDAVERMQDDTMFLPSALGVKISADQEDVLLKALEVSYNERYHSMREFYQDMASSGRFAPDTVNRQTAFNKESNRVSSTTARTEQEAKERAERLECELREAKEEAARLEQERKEREAREEAARREQERREREAREEAARLERERKEREAKEAEERRKKELAEKKAREEAERQEKLRLEREKRDEEKRLAAEKKKQEAAEKERLRQEALAKQEQSATKKRSPGKAIAVCAIVALVILVAVFLLPKKASEQPSVEPSTALETTAPIETAIPIETSLPVETPVPSVETPAPIETTAPMETTGPDISAPILSEPEAEPEAEQMQAPLQEEQEESATPEEPEDPYADFRVVGNTVTFGNYEQDNDLENGKEPIEWVVLDVQDGKSLLISKYGIDYSSSPVWAMEREDSGLRAYLNFDFVSEAFSDWEKELIHITHNVNGSESLLTAGQESGESTEDRIFLLSYDEVVHYFPRESERSCLPTAFTAENGTRIMSNENCMWATRTSGTSTLSLTVITPEGGAYSYDSRSDGELSANKRSYALRPAMWVDNAVVPAEDASEEGFQVGSKLFLGHYEQDDNPENGMEPIEWRVIQVEGDQALLLSTYGLTILPYHESVGNVTWETCSLRAWLNDDFLRNSFDENERNLILTTDVDNGALQKNQKFYTDGGNNTQDKIFLLSRHEVEQYLTADYIFDTCLKRYCIATPAAKESWSKGWELRYIGSWWLRSPGKDQTCVDFLDHYGITIEDLAGTNGGWSAASSRALLVRPAMWVNLAELTAVPTEQQQSTVPQKVNSNANDLQTVGNIVTFGHYEQDNNLSNSKEPIEWIVLDAQDGKSLLLSKYGLDCQPYNANKLPVTWETSSIREWLNSSFLNEAFSAEEQAKILLDTVSADKNPGYDTTTGNDTTDKLFLLSTLEAESYFSTEEERKCPLTEYAKAQGCYTSDPGNFCWWWLRSPGFNSYTAVHVNRDGSIFLSGDGVEYGNVAVRPAIWVNWE